VCNITAFGDPNHGGETMPATQLSKERCSMPILMLALLALGAFVAIGGLLATATILERRKGTEQKEADAKTTI
jgi:hypothetical protein